MQIRRFKGFRQILFKTCNATLVALMVFSGPLKAAEDEESGKETSGSIREDVAALRVACGIEKRPGRSRDPFKRDGSLSEGWGDGDLKPGMDDWSRNDRKKAFANPVCEQFMLQQIQKNENTSRVKDRCESIRDDLYLANAELRNSSASTGNASANFSALDSLLSGNDDESDDDSGDPCEDRVSGDESDFACNYVAFKDSLESPSAQKQAASQVLSYCTRLGANMTPQLTEQQYASLTGAGIDAYGGGMCGPRGGTIVIKKENKWYDTLGNVALGMTKVLAPTLTMWDIAKRQQSNARHAINSNRVLGFPSVVTAGSGYGQGGYYGGGYGGNFYGGGACGGYSGGCPTGACPGNCGVVVGGGGYAGGAHGGGACGIPPYSPSYGGCGAVGGGGYGVGGGYGGGYGGGGGFPGPYGNAGGGYGGAGGLPGPYGTAGGGNGYGAGGNPFGYNGAYGGPQAWGGGTQNAQYMQAQAAMYEAYAAQMARRARETSQAAKVYQNTLDDQKAVEERSYQAYMAYTMAQYGLSSPGQTSTSGGRYPTNSGGYSSGGYVPGQYVTQQQGAYYPPYSSGSGLNLSVGASYSSGASQR